MYILRWQHISVQSSPKSSVQQLHVASGYHKGNRALRPQMGSEIQKEKKHLLNVYDKSNFQKHQIVLTYIVLRCLESIVIICK